MRAASRFVLPIAAVVLGASLLFASMANASGDGPPATREANRFVELAKQDVAELEAAGLLDTRTLRLVAATTPGATTPGATTPGATAPGATAPGATATPDGPRYHLFGIGTSRGTTGAGATPPPAATPSRTPETPPTPVGRPETFVTDPDDVDMGTNDFESIRMTASTNGVHVTIRLYRPGFESSLSPCGVASGITVTMIGVASSSSKLTMLTVAVLDGAFGVVRFTDQEGYVPAYQGTWEGSSRTVEFDLPRELFGEGAVDLLWLASATAHPDGSECVQQSPLTCRLLRQDRAPELTSTTLPLLHIPE